MSSFNFTWGLPEIDDIGFVQVFRFMLRAYAKLGITRQEMLCLIHLASYHYNTPKGESRPSLTTIAREMGYGDRARASALIRSLESKKMLIVDRSLGEASVYNARPFAKAAWELFLEGVAEKRTPQSLRCAEKRTGGVRKSAHEEEESRTIVVDDGWTQSEIFSLEQQAAFDDLIGLGMTPNRAAVLALTHEPRRIQNAIDKATEESTGNVAGLVVWLLENETALLPIKPYRYEKK